MEHVNGDSLHPRKPSEEPIAVACWATFKIDPWSPEAKGTPEGNAVSKKIDAIYLAGKEEWKDRKEFADMLFNDLVEVSKTIPGLTGTGKGHMRTYFSKHSIISCKDSQSILIHTQISTSSSPLHTTTVAAPALHS